MKYYVQFLQVRNEKIYEILGSEGVFILDGRNNLLTMKVDAIERALLLKNIHKISGWRIMKGTFRASVCIYEFIRQAV